ncbi:23 kDa jasmonate-induced protein-like isoform X2 [Elaeis guineensis]|uniref:23 kDa jasmonate-induced protein-like isoform X2 n=1 Tax=Elaeis guineensis var. tenera TaxID=51953 RepID=UPI003C6CDEDA
MQSSIIKRGHQFSYRNVFGNPITDETLRGMPEYKEKPEITATERAKVALNMRNAGDKHVEAHEFVEGLKDDCGGRLDFVPSGHIGASPYPQQINNGQWGAYLHVDSKGAAVGSSAAVVYWGKMKVQRPVTWL